MLRTWLIVACLAACSVPPPAPPVAPAPAPVKVVVPSEPVAPPPEPVGSTHVDPGIEVEYRVTARDCEEIADHVSELVSADLRAKLGEKKLNDKQRQTAERDAEQAAAEEREAWLKQCQSLVGEVQKRSRIDCAIAAESVKAVDDCLNQ